MKENQLRDLIAANIEVLEPALQLLKKEQYIPNRRATKSFIDLYAKDEWGHHVLIELKRSNAAAREAIHEIHKYVEGVKSDLGANDDEIRVIIASTEWRELLVPFSRLVQDTSIAIQGLQIHINEETGIISSELIRPIEIKKSGRCFAPWHELNLYFDRDSLNQGIKSYENSYKQKGIKDYVLVILKPAKFFFETCSELDKYEYMLYFAMQELSDPDCRKILLKLGSNELREEIDYFLEETPQEDHLEILHHNVYDLHPRPHYDWFEIGYPAKFSCKILDEEAWDIIEVLRYGIFSKNKILTDDDIISALCGHEGKNKVRFKKKISSANKAHISKARFDLKTCLVDNPIWQAHILKIINEIKEDFSNSEIEISLLNPCTGIVSVLNYLIYEDGELYMPSYQVIVKTNILRRYYFGCLIGEKTNTTLGNILDKYYEGSLGTLIDILSARGYDKRDTDILEDIGLTYRTFRYDIHKNKVTPFTLINERWRPTGQIEPSFYYKKYVEENPDLMEEIMDKIASCFITLNKVNSIDF